MKCCANVRSLRRGLAGVGLVGIVAVSGWSIYRQDAATRPLRISEGSYPQTMYGLLDEATVRRVEPEVTRLLRLMHPRPVRNSPTFAREAVEASRAAIDSATRVVGVSINGEAKAYALSLFRRHMLLAGINDEVGGRKLLVTH